MYVGNDKKELRRLRFELVMAMLSEDSVLAKQIKNYLGWGA